MAGRSKKLAVTNNAFTPGDSNHPRLGFVVRFKPDARDAGIKELESNGMKVASSSSFRTAKAVPNDFGGADVQYFERFGLAVIREPEQRVDSTLQAMMEKRIVDMMRPERRYQPLGRSRAASESEAEGPALASSETGLLSPGATRDYLIGYRDGVTHLIEGLIGNAEGSVAVAAQAFSDDTHTWGLKATRVTRTRLTGAGIRVAVLDTGFDEKHPDFRGRKVVKKLFASKSVDHDVHGHGTHCIGTACGPLKPISGPRYGIAYEAEIYAGKVLGDDGFGTDRSIIAGMEWALEQDCQIISMSLGAATAIGAQPIDDYEHIGRVCLDAGTLVVAAAGNESRRPLQIAPVGSPANASTIMAVGAVDERMAVAAFSCGGLNIRQDVDLVAPGVNVLSSLPGGSYDRWNGTSMATPHVAGIAALIAQSDPQYRGWTLWARMTQLCRRLALPARDVGSGLVQVPVD